MLTPPSLTTRTRISRAALQLVGWWYILPCCYNLNLELYCRMFRIKYCGTCTGTKQKLNIHWGLNIQVTIIFKTWFPQLFSRIPLLSFWGVAVMSLSSWLSRLIMVHIRFLKISCINCT